MVVTESEKKQEILLVDEKSSNLGKLLKKELKRYDASVYMSPHLPENTERFEYLFLLNKHPDQIPAGKKSKQRLIMIYVNNRKKAQQALGNIQKNSIPNAKVVFTNSEHLTDTDVEKLLWFSFSKSKESILRLTVHERHGPAPKKTSVEIQPYKLFTKKNIAVFFLIIFFLYHLIIYPPLFLSSFLIYKAGSAFRKGDLAGANQYLTISEKTENLSKSLYAFSRYSYLLFGLALFPDTVVEINDKGIETLQKTYSSYENAKHVMTLIFKKDKTKQEKSLLEVRLAKLQENIDDIRNNLLVLDQKLADLPFGIASSYRKDLIKSSELITKVDDILPYAEKLLSKGKESKYLLLFANNMELRPGGGFIGSFGVVTMNDLTLQDIKIYDVYDADGQLIIHVNPPEPIRRYLNQPHWFLRDSAFSPDFFDNYNQAKYFLDQELKLGGFSGGIIITTTAIQNLLTAYETIYLPGFDEQINKDNFYLKAQFYAEKDFFPGSIQKKSFLGSVADQIILNVDAVSPLKLFQQIRKSLDEKQIAVLIDDPEVQQIFDTLYWSGKTITPRCIVQNTNCIIDYVFPIDANLGVNKANFFISRLITQRVNIDENGVVTSNLFVKLQNDSPNNIFPGGTYKDYFQVLLPKGAIVQEVALDGVRVNEYDEAEVVFKSVGFFLQLPPKRSSEIKVSYRLPQQLKSGKSVYQLIFQKQIGSNNSDLILEITLPKNVSLTNQNFSPLVKDNRIFYNTSLSADKIFVLELLK